MPKKSNFKIKKTYVLIFALSAIMFLSVYFVLTKVRKLLETDVMVNLNEIAKQNAEVIANKVKLDIGKLELIAEQLSEKFDDITSEEALSYLKMKETQGGYNTLMATNSAGTAYITSGASADISGRLYFKKTMSGISHISERVVSRITGEEVHVCSVPVYRNGEIIGIVGKSYTVDELSGIFDVSLFSDKGYINVINDEGEILLRSNSNGLEFINNNYFRELYLYGNKQNADKIKSDLQAGNVGFVDLLFDNQSLFASYTPIEDVYDWYLISVVPSDVISYNASLVSRIFMAVLSAMLLIIISFAVVFIVNSRRYQEKLQVMAFYDDLTGGKTLNKFMVDAAAILENADQAMGYTLIKFDIDNFKYVNELYGYDVGDKLLKTLYDEINSCLSENEIVARGSGDNFVILVSNSDFSYIEGILADPVSAVCIDLGISFNVSAGAYIINEYAEGSMNIVSMLDNATVASKAIKGNSKEWINYYSDKMGAALKEEEEIKQTMKKALENGQFKPFYQPKTNMFESKIVGAEVLVRWEHPEKGLIPPFKFISLFEKNGFIVDVDLYMFQCVCMKIKKYIEEGINPIPISVNFSRIHLNNRSFIDKIKSYVIEYDVPPSFIEIEITESAFFDNLDMVFEVTNQLKEFGFSIAMDDFGSGYSSLNMLKEIPIDILKIDKEFFKETRDSKRRETVVESIVDMAHRLDIDIVAEGVETKEQVEFLKRINCQIAQGYFYSKPLPSDSFDELYCKNNGFIL